MTPTALPQILQALSNMTVRSEELAVHNKMLTERCIMLASQIKQSQNEAAELRKERDKLLQQIADLSDHDGPAPTPPSTPTEEASNDAA